MAEILGQGLIQVDSDANLQGFKSLFSAMRQVSTETGKAVKSTMNFNKGTAKVVIGLDQMSRASNKASTSTAGFSDSLFQTSFALTAVSTSMGLVIRQVGEIGFDFNRNMALVKAVTGSTGSEFEALSGLAREMGRQTEYGASKAAEGLLVLSRMGLNAAKSMRVLGPAIQLAQSQQHDLKQSTELVVQQLKVFGKTVDEASRFSNVLAATSSMTAADLDKLNIALGFAGPVAASTGRDFEELNATLGLMFNAGQRASRAGTSLRFGLAALMGTTTAAEKALKKIGLTIKDVDPATNSLSDIFTKLADKLRGVENKAAAFFDIFGKRAATSMGAVVEQVIRNRDAFDELQRSITDTSEAERQFKTQLESVSGQLLILKSELQETFVGLFESVGQEILIVVGGLKQLLNIFQSLPSWMKEVSVIFGALVTAAAAIGASVAGLAFAFKNLSAVSNAMGASLSKPFITMRANMKATQAAIAAMNTQMKFLNAGFIKMDLRRQKAFAISKEASQRIALLVQERMATEKNTAAKLRAARAAIAEGVAIETGNKAIQRAVLKKLELWRVTEMGSKSFGNLSRSAISLKGVFSGLFTALGGWVGITTMAVGLLASAFLKLKADAEEAARKQKEMLDAVAASAGELENKLKTLAEVEEDLSKDSAKNNVTALNALMEEKAAVTKEVREIQKKLIELNPLLLKTYDLEKGKIEINIKKLEELIALREREAVKSESKSSEAQNEFERFLDNLDKIGKEKGAGAKLGELRRKSDELRAKVAELSDEAEFFTEKIKEQTKEVSKASAAAAQGLISFSSAEAATASSISLYRKEVEKAENKQADYSRQLVLVEDMLDKMRSALLGAKDGTKELAEGLDDAGKGAKRAHLNLLSLINSVIDFVNKMKDLQEELTFEINFEDKSDIDTKLAKISLDTRIQSKKIQEDLDELARKYNDKMEKIIKGKKYSLEQLNKLTDEMVSAITEADKSQELLAQRGKQKLNETLKDYLKEYRKSNRDLKLESDKLQVELNTMFEGSAATIQDKYKVAFETISNDLRDMVEEIEDNLSNIPEVAEEQYKKLALIKEQYGIRIREADKNRADEEVNNVKEALDSWKDSFSTKYKQTLSFNFSYIKQLETMRDRAAVIYKDDYKSFVKVARSIEREMGNTLDAINSKIMNWANTVTGALGAFAGDDLSALTDFIGSYVGSIGSFASGNYAEGVSGLIDSFADLKTSFDAMHEEERKWTEERANREKELLDYQNQLLSEARSTNKNIADALRQMLGFGSSMESIGTIIDEIGKSAADRLDAASGVKTKGKLFGVNPGYKDNNELRDILIGIASSTTGKSPAGYTHDFTGILEEGNIEKGKDYVARLIDVYAGLVSALEPSKDLSFGPDTSLAEVENITKQMGFASSRYSFSPDSYGNRDYITESGMDFIEQMDKLIGRSSIINNNAIAGGSYPGGFDNSTADIFQAIRGVYLSQAPLEALEILHTELPKAIADGMDNAELLEILMGVKNVFDEYTDKSVGGFDVVSGKDYLELIKRISDSMLIEAGDDKNAQIEAHRFLINGIKDTVSEFGTQFTLGELTEDIPNLLISTNDKIEELGSVPENIRDVLDSTLVDFTSNLKSVTDSISSEFNSGYISFDEAMSSISELRKAIEDMPEDIQVGLTNIIDKMEKSLLESANQKRKMAQDKVGVIGSSTEDFISDLDKIDGKFLDIEENWRGLIGDRLDVISEFEVESKKLQAESDQRIKDLEDERAAIIGTFDFNETQNERSKRFARVRELEKSILDEIVETTNKLQDMEEKRDESLSKIDDKLDELKEKYESLEELAKNHQEARNEREADFVRYLKEESQILTELLGKSIMLGRSFELLNMFSGRGSEDIASLFSGMLGHSLSGTISDSFPNDIEGRIAELVNRIKEYTVASIESSISTIASRSAIAEADPVISSTPEHPSIPNVWDMNNFHAAKGFEGVVSKPTQFTVGENFKPEYVSVTPLSDMKKFMGGMINQHVTNVYINESIDLRGAYGITSDSVAEEVYKKVWAPARRRNLDRFIGVKGRVVR